MSAVLDDLFVYPVRIDWKRLITELRAAKWTPYRVAHQLGVDHQTVYGWESGKEPRHSYGAALISLHRAVCGIESSQKLYMHSEKRL